MSELNEILIQIQDHLVPKLDTYEQAIYHLVFRHTYLVGEKQMWYSTRAAEIGFGSGNNAVKPSMNTRSKKIRSLESKGAVRIIERSNKGILVEIILPNEMDDLIESAASTPLQLADLDFFKDRRLLPSLLERENYRCFYTGKIITEKNCYLDHVTPQSKGGNNSYNNIVTTCYEANSMKSDTDVEDFARMLFKDGLLSLEEFKELNKKIEDLQKGLLIPDEQTISKAISS